ncbi:hypothetical protein ACB098_02G035900 [Castanea mollissima]
MDSKNGVDVSSSLFFEDTADSETDAGDPNNIHADVGAAYDDQDAESCSYDTRDNTLGFTKAVDCDDQDSEVTSRCVSKKEGEEETKVDKIDVDEMEDRVFWETCMEGGYP